MTESTNQIHSLSSVGNLCRNQKNFCSITLMYGWKTTGEWEAKTNLVNISDSIFRFEVEESAFSIPGVSDPMWSARQSGKTTTSSFRTEKAPI